MRKFAACLGAAVGATLLIAGTLKLTAASHDSYLTGVWAPTFFSAGLVAIQVLVATALIRRPLQRSSWAACWLLFLLFSSVAGTRWIAGTIDCGCAGSVHVAPLWMLIGDSTVVVITAGLMIHFRHATSWNQPHSDFWRHCVGLMVAVGAVATGAVVVSVSPPVSDAMGFDTGIRTVMNPVLATPVARHDEYVSMDVPIHNLGTDCLRVHGVQSRCGIHFETELPFEMKPGSVTDVTLVAKLPRQAATGSVSLELYVSGNCAMRQLIRVMVIRKASHGQFWRVML
jgi:Methylamine utilisation protein MauE